MKELPYLLILMRVWPGDWGEQLDRMSKKVDEENVRWETQENGRFWKLWRFLRN